MGQEISKDERELMIMQIMMNTKFSEEALNKMSDKEIVRLHRDRVQAD